MFYSFLFPACFASSPSFLGFLSVAQQHSTFPFRCFHPLPFTVSPSDHLAPEPSVSLCSKCTHPLTNIVFTWCCYLVTPQKKKLTNINHLLITHSFCIHTHTHTLMFLYLVPCEQLCEEGPNLWSIFIVWSISWAHKHAGNADRGLGVMCACVSVVVRVWSSMFGLLLKLASFTWTHITSRK